MRQVKIEASWKDQLAAEFAADYMAELSQFLRDEKAAGKRIYPPNNEIFAAFDMTPFAKVKVVILGQDPYHGLGQAHGYVEELAVGLPAGQVRSFQQAILPNSRLVVLPYPYDDVTAWELRLYVEPRQQL